MKPERPGLALRLLALLLLCLLLALLVWMRTLPTTAERPTESPVPQETAAPVPTPAATERPAQSAAPTAPVPTASDPTGAPLVYTEESYRLVSDLVYTYAALQREGEAEIRERLARLKEADPRLGGVWEEILGVWDYVNTELAVPASIPEGLPQDESLCIVVLGFQLHADGSMAQELLGRCQTALAAAERYPRARIAVTGGGTAFQNRAATEAGVMAQWLRDQGIGEERILIEDRSLTTADNAVFTCELLRRDAPEVKTLVIVSSDYHLPLGVLLFEEKAILLGAEEGEKPFRVAACAAWDTQGQFRPDTPMEQKAYLWSVADPKF